MGPRQQGGTTRNRSERIRCLEGRPLGNQRTVVHFAANNCIGQSTKESMWWEAHRNRQGVYHPNTPPRTRCGDRVVSRLVRPPTPSNVMMTHVLLCQWIRHASQVKTKTRPILTCRVRGGPSELLACHRLDDWLIGHSLGTTSKVVPQILP
jgi:hypothetical protein